MSNYILDESGNPQACPDLLEWARWFETAERHIGDTTIGDSRISTVFIGIDHSFGYGPPLLFETMVFGGPMNEFQDRYTTRAEALAGHESVCQQAAAAIRTPETGEAGK